MSQPKKFLFIGLYLLGYILTPVIFTTLVMLFRDVGFIISGCITACVVFYSSTRLGYMFGARMVYTGTISTGCDNFIQLLDRADNINLFLTPQYFFYVSVLWTIVLVFLAFVDAPLFIFIGVIVVLGAICFGLGIIISYKINVDVVSKV